MQIVRFVADVHMQSPTYSNDSFALLGDILTVRT